jgi:hypothetical protein
MLTALARPAAKAAVISPAVIQAKSKAVVSSTERRGRLALIRQREAVDDRRMLEQQLEIERNACVPGRLDWQRQGLYARGGEYAQFIGVAAAQEPRWRPRAARRFRLAVEGFAGHAQGFSEIRASGCVA